MLNMIIPSAIINELITLCLQPKEPDNLINSGHHSLMKTFDVSANRVFFCMVLGEHQNMNRSLGIFIPN